MTILSERLLAELCDRCDLLQVRFGERNNQKGVEVAVAKKRNRGRQLQQQWVAFSDPNLAGTDDRPAMAIFYALAMLHRRIGL